MEKCATAAVAPEDRRDALRQATSLTNVVWIMTPESELIRADILDVSRTGMRLRAERALVEGDVVTVRPPSGTNLPPLQAEVVRSIGDGAEGAASEFGIRFTQVRSDSRHAWFLNLRSV